MKNFSDICGRNIIKTFSTSENKTKTEAISIIKEKQL